MLGAYLRLLDFVCATNAGAMLGYGAVHALAVLLGHLLATPDGHYSGVWPAVGVQAAFLAMTPSSRRFAMLSAAGLTEAALTIWHFWPSYSSAQDALAEVPHAAINAISAALVAGVYRRLCGDRLPDARVSVLVFLAILAVLLAGATLGSTWLLWIEDAAFLPGVWNWYITDLLGIFAAGVPALVWGLRARGHRAANTGSMLELAGISVAAMAVAELMFAGERFSTDFRVPYLLFPVMLWAAARYHPSIVATLGGGLTLYITYLNNHVTGSGMNRLMTDPGQLVPGTSVEPEALLPLQLLLTVLLMTSMLLSIALNERRALNRRLLEVSQRITVEQQHARQRFAVELRDGIDGALTAIAASLGDNGPASTDPQIVQRLDDCRRLVADIRASVRNLADDLTLQFSDTSDFGTALRRVQDRMHAEHALDVTCELRDGLAELTPTRATMALRIVQELLLNVVRHAGIGRAEVIVQERNDMLQIDVNDCGAGFDMQRLRQSGTTGFGLRSIHDQVEEEGGSLVIDSAPGDGCRVRVRFAKGEP